MTLDEFYVELAEVKDKFKWIIRNGYIAGCLDRSEYCPITALAYIKFTEDIPNASYLKAAGKLSLNEEVAHQIAGGADFICETPVRLKLLEILDLG